MQQPVRAHYMNRPLAALSLFSLLNTVEITLVNIFYLSAHQLQCRDAGFTEKSSCFCII